MLHFLYLKKTFDVLSFPKAGIVLTLTPWVYYYQKFFFDTGSVSSVIVGGGPSKPKMSGDTDGNKEFHEQLRLQQLYGQRPGDGADPNTFVDPEDGTVYDWDHDKKAWFPKITEDFLAAYQANYGFTKDGQHDPNAACAPDTDTTAKPEEGKKAEKRTDTEQLKDGKKEKGEKRKADTAAWFDVETDKNTNVYVSGLPPDITTEEFVEVMSKCGIVMRDPISEEYKVKLYRDGQGNQKGDGLCCYLKKESVALAERLIDESEIRGYQLHVEAARFELKGQYDASKKKKKSKDYRKRMKAQQKQLDWRPEKKGEARKRHERVLIIQNMFHPSDFEEDPLVLNEYRDDLRTECEKFGQVKKVIIFDRHPDGVASVAFKEPEDADVCQMALDGRWFGGKKLSAQLWDGSTDYQVEETTREREERLKGWAAYLEGGSKGPAPPGAPPGSTEGPTTTTEESSSKAEGPVTEPSNSQSQEAGAKAAVDPGVEPKTSEDAEVAKINQSSAQRRETHVLVMVVSMVSCYLLCWMPYGVVALLATFGQVGLVSPTTSIVPSILAKSSTFLNPVIYGLLNNQFYRCFLAFMSCGSEAAGSHTLHTVPSSRVVGPNGNSPAPEEPGTREPLDGSGTSSKTQTRGQQRDKRDLVLVVHYTP